MTSPPHAERPVAPSRPARSRGWRSEAARDRRLRLLQLVVLIAASGVCVVLVVLFGRALAGAGEERDAHAAHLRELSALRNELQDARVDFYRQWASGELVVPPSVVLGAALAVDGVGRLSREEGAETGRLSDDARRALAASQKLQRLVLAAARTRSPLTPGRGEVLVARAEKQVAVLENALEGWIAAERRQVTAAAQQARLLQRRLAAGLAGTLAAALVLALVAWLFVSRSRRRLAGEVVRQRDERGTLLGALQDGLVMFSDTGRIEEVSARFSEMTGIPRGDLVGAHSPFLAWRDPKREALGRAFSALLGHGAGSAHVRLPSSSGREDIDATASLAPRTTPLGEPDGWVATVKDVTERRRAEDELRRVAAGQGALRRVATAVAASDSTVTAFALAALEAARLLGVPAGLVVRFAEDGLEVMGSAGPAEEPEGRPGGAVAEVARTGAACRRRDGETPGREVTVAVPIRAEGELWGALAAVGPLDGVIPQAEAALAPIASLLGLAVANGEARRQLESQADSDPVTGLANHRVFHERLAAEVDRARHHGRQLSVAILDLDHFKAVNDAYGHQAGDRVLRDTAGRLGGALRPGDVLARVGGEEFAVVMPETAGAEARDAVEAMRAAVAAAPFGDVGHLTMSAGVCDLVHAGDPDAFVRLADGALYWAKAHGRDRVLVYSPDVVQELSASDRAARLERDHLVAGLRGLARAVDAKDRRTSKHGERVADLAVAIAGRLGWGEDRRSSLHEAALLHDVGKIGVPDELLRKDGFLNPDERATVRAHAALGAEMVAEILTEEQASWIRHHHERPDGTGYPDGLRGTAIPEGARIIAVAEAWDAMTTARPWADARDHEDAARECQTNAGSQFDAAAVGALLAIVAPALATAGGAAGEGET